MSFIKKKINKKTENNLYSFFLFKICSFIDFSKPKTEIKPIVITNSTYLRLFGLYTSIPPLKIRVYTRDYFLPWPQLFLQWKHALPAWPRHNGLHQWSLRGHKGQPFDSWRLPQYSKNEEAFITINEQDMMMIFLAFYFQRKNTFESELLLLYQV